MYYYVNHNLIGPKLVLTIVNWLERSCKYFTPFSAAPELERNYKTKELYIIFNFIYEKCVKTSQKHARALSQLIILVRTITISCALSTVV